MSARLARPSSGLEDARLTRFHKVGQLGCQELGRQPQSQDNSNAAHETPITGSNSKTATYILPLRLCKLGIVLQQRDDIVGQDIGIGITPC